MRHSSFENFRGFFVLTCFEALTMKHFIKICFLICFCKGTLSAPRKPRLSLAEHIYPTYFIRNIDGIPGTYSFSYDVSDIETGNYQFRMEERYPNSSVIGIYGYRDPSGLERSFEYVADKEGYRVSEIKHSDTNTNEKTTEPFRQTDQPNESPIIWTRPPNPKKKRPVKPLLDKMKVHKKPQEFNLDGPHSLYYVDY